MVFQIFWIFYPKNWGNDPIWLFVFFLTGWNQVVSDASKKTMNKWSIGQAKHIEKQAPCYEGNEYVLARCRPWKFMFWQKGLVPQQKQVEISKKKHFCVVFRRFIPCVSTSWIVSQNPSNEKNHLKLHILQTGNAAAVMVQKCLIFLVEGVLWFLCSVEKI